MHLLVYFTLLLSVFGILAGAASVTLYSEQGYTGNSITVSDSNGTNACYNLPSSFVSQSTSLTTSGVTGITVYSTADCQGTSVSFFAPVSWMGDIWDNRLVSFKFAPSLPVEGAPAPANPEISFGVCEFVLIVDNYVTRSLNKSMSMTEIYNKYKSYATDIDAYYRNNFNVHLKLSYIYVEDGPSFSSSMNANILLSDFSAAVAQKRFGSAMPSGACVYHLITGRQPPGIAGLAYLGVACGATGFAVDVNGQDGAGIVLRRSIHEIGHNFNGNHPDGYVLKIPPYSPCSINNDIGVNRILRSSAIPYTYLEEGTRISECATNQMKNSMAAFQCLYKNNAFISPFSEPSMTFYQDGQYAGDAFTVVARQGVNACYNLMSFSSSVSSFKTNQTNIVGIKAYQNSDCRGSPRDYSSATNSLSFVWNDKIVSFKFIVV